MARNEEKLGSGLSKTQKEFFEKYKDCVDEYNTKLQENAFFEGLSFGIKIVAFTLGDS